MMVGDFFEDTFELVGKEMPILVNIKPALFRGFESQGMIRAADVDGKPILLHPEQEIPPGSRVK